MFEVNLTERYNLRGFRHAIAVFLAFLILLAPVTSRAAKKRTKKKTASTRKTPKKGRSETVLNDAYYDDVWRKFQIGTPKEKKAVISELKALVKKNPTEWTAHYYLGIMFAESKTPRSAENHFKTALAGFPNSADLHFRYAEILFQKRNVDEAREHFQKARELAPDHGPTLARLGVFALQDGKTPEAKDLLELARKKVPDNRETLAALGAVYVELRQFDQAVEVLNIALALDDKDPEAHWALGKAYEGLNRAKEAETEFAMAKKLGRRDPDIKNLVGYDLARALSDQGKIEEAIAEYKKAIKTAEDPAQGWREIARIYEDYGRTKEALKALDKVLEYDAESIETVNRIAEIYRNQDQLEAALDMWKALSRRKAFREVAKERVADLTQELQMREKDQLRDLAETSSDPKIREDALLRIYDMDKKDQSALENLRDFYIEFKVYKEAIKYVRRLVKEKHISKWEADRDIDDLKEKEKSGE